MVKFFSIYIVEEVYIFTKQHDGLSDELKAKLYAEVNDSGIDPAVFRTIYQSNETCHKLDKRRPNK